ncbi:MAG: hypothetical protein ACE5H1_01970 [Thermodesulfobacteriota bacterium]
MQIGSYKPRSLIEGTKLKLFARKLPKGYHKLEFVGVPNKRFINDMCKVQYNNQHMVVIESAALTSKEFEDMWNPGQKYSLYYYQWEPEQKDLF